VCGLGGYVNVLLLLLDLFGADDNYLLMQNIDLINISYDGFIKYAGHELNEENAILLTRMIRLLVACGTITTRCIARTRKEPEYMPRLIQIQE
jgi:hypothetical protein